MKRIAEYRNEEMRCVLQSFSQHQRRLHLFLQLPSYSSRCEGPQQRDRVLITGPVFRVVDRYVCRDRSRA